MQPSIAPTSNISRAVYAAEVVEAVRKGRAIPSGAVMTLVQWSVEVFSRQRAEDAASRAVKKASFTLEKPGEYNYICGLHPTTKGMIEVK